MPKMFFQKVCNRVISTTDYFEIFIDKPSGIDAECKTYSGCKNHNTCRFLISITPQGTLHHSLKLGMDVQVTYILQKKGFHVDLPTQIITP